MRRFKITFPCWEEAVILFRDKNKEYKCFTQKERESPEFYYCVFYVDGIEFSRKRLYVENAIQAPFIVKEELQEVIRLFRKILDDIIH